MTSRSTQVKVLDIFVVLETLQTYEYNTGASWQSNNCYETLNCILLFLIGFDGRNRCINVETEQKGVCFVSTRIGKFRTFVNFQFEADVFVCWFCLVTNTIVAFGFVEG